MSNQITISVIIPCYNAEKYIQNCLELLLQQNFEKNLEIIIVDDASNDKTIDILKNYQNKNIKSFFLKKNSGPATARNIGLKEATGEYVFFLDVDDRISTNIFSSLYAVAKLKNFDMVFCDKKLIENSKNQRDNIFYYSSDKEFNKLEIIDELFDRFTNPFSYSGIFLHYGKLIKRSLLIDNNIFFEEKLRYLEDEVFGWDTLAFANNVAYIRKQHYTYYVNPKANTARSDAFNKGYPITNFYIIKKHIKDSLLTKGINLEKAEKLSNHAFAYFIINSLVSYNMSIMLEKMNTKTGRINLKNFIKEITLNPEIVETFRKYSPSKNESKWIPKAIVTKSILLIQFACNQRCKAILNKSRNS